MTIPEYLKTGNRKCKCQGVKLSVTFDLIKRQISRHNDSFKNLYDNVIFGVITKDEGRHNARCSQCNKLYMSSKNKKTLMKSIKDSGMEIEK